MEEETKDLKLKLNDKCSANNGKSSLFSDMID